MTDCDKFIEMFEEAGYFVYVNKVLLGDTLYTYVDCKELRFEFKEGKFNSFNRM